MNTLRKVIKYLPYEMQREVFMELMDTLEIVELLATIDSEANDLIIEHLYEETKES